MNLVHSGTLSGSDELGSQSIFSVDFFDHSFSSWAGAGSDFLGDCFAGLYADAEQSVSYDTPDINQITVSANYSFGF